MVESNQMVKRGGSARSRRGWLNLDHPAGNCNLSIAPNQSKLQFLPRGKSLLEGRYHPHFVDPGDATSQPLEGLPARALDCALNHHVREAALGPHHFLTRAVGSGGGRRTPRRAWCLHLGLRRARHPPGQIGLAGRGGRSGSGLPGAEVWQCQAGNDSELEAFLALLRRGRLSPLDRAVVRPRLPPPFCFGALNLKLSGERSDASGQTFVLLPKLLFPPGGFRSLLPEPSPVGSDLLHAFDQERPPRHELAEPLGKLIRSSQHLPNGLGELPQARELLLSLRRRRCLKFHALH